MKYPFEKHIVVCIGGRCNTRELGENGGEAIRHDLKQLNKELGNRKRIRVCSVSCLDLCDFGPNMIVWPDGTVYSHLDRVEARAVYQSIVDGRQSSADSRQSSVDSCQSSVDSRQPSE